jgi:hypothetical protein
MQGPTMPLTPSLVSNHPPFPLGYECSWPHSTASFKQIHKFLRSNPDTVCIGGEAPKSAGHTRPVSPLASTSEPIHCHLSDKAESPRSQRSPKISLVPLASSSQPPVETKSPKATTDLYLRQLNPISLTSMQALSLESIGPDSTAPPRGHHNPPPLPLCWEIG